MHRECKLDPLTHILGVPRRVCTRERTPLVCLRSFGYNIASYGGEVLPELCMSIAARNVPRGVFSPNVLFFLPSYRPAHRRCWALGKSCPRRHRQPRSQKPVHPLASGASANTTCLRESVQQPSCAGPGTLRACTSSPDLGPNSPAFTPRSFASGNQSHYVQTLSRGEDQRTGTLSAEGVAGGGAVRGGSELGGHPRPWRSGRARGAR